MSPHVARIIGLGEDEGDPPKTPRDWLLRNLPKPEPKDTAQGWDEINGPDENAETEEASIAQAWADDQNGEYVQINDDGSAYFIAHGMRGERIAPPGTENTYLFTAIRAWMNRNRYWPNVWSVNDHGNVSLFDFNGNYLGGVV